MQLVFRKITAPGAQIAPRVAQNIHQLQPPAIIGSQLEHVRFEPCGKTLYFAKTNTRPKFAHRTSHEIGVVEHFLRIGQRGESFAPSRQILSLTTRDTCEQYENIALISMSKILQ